MNRLTTISTLVSILLGILAAAANLRAQEPEQARVDQSRIDRLISRLSHPRYVVRQQAEAELIKIGPAARDALERAVKSHDYELRRRAKWLLATLDDLELRRRLRLFVEQGTIPDHTEFKSWKPFSDVVGEDRPARELFAAAQQYDQSLLADLGARPADALARYRELATNLEDFSDTHVDEGALAALLFVAGEKSLAWDDDARRAMYELWPMVNDFTRLLEGQYADHYRKLMARWIALPAPGDCNYQRLWLCARHNLRQGLEPALSVLKEANQHDEALYPALVAVGLFGSQDHVPLLEKQFRNADLCDTIAGFDNDVEIQYRDVALASAIRLTGQKIEDYAFASELDPETQVQKHGFAGRIDRMHAFRQWQTWKSNKEKKAKP